MADMDGLRYSPDDPQREIMLFIGKPKGRSMMISNLMTPTTALGLSIRLSMFELRETGGWDIFLGPPERVRAETGGADQWVLKRRECSGFARVNKVTSASLGYPLSVFNKNYTLKATHSSKSETGS